MPNIIFGGVLDVIECTIFFLPQGVMFKIDRSIQAPTVVFKAKRKLPENSLGGYRITDAEKLVTTGETGVYDRKTWEVALVPFFKEHTMELSHERTTLIRFYSGDAAWKFDAPVFGALGQYGFAPKNPADWPRFQNTKPCIAPGTGFSGVETRFVPDGKVYESFSYELRMRTDALNESMVPKGHVIIIIDPIMETREI